MLHLNFMLALGMGGIGIRECAALLKQDFIYKVVIYCLGVLPWTSKCYHLLWSFLIHGAT